MTVASRRFTAGIFEVEVSAPSPMWVEVKDLSRSGPDLRGVRFHPANLKDLQHVIERAIAYVDQHDPGTTT